MLGVKRIILHQLLCAGQRGIRLPSELTLLGKTLLNLDHVARTLAPRLDVNATIRESFGGDRNTFIKTLQAQNYTLSKFRDLERDKIIVQAWRAKNVKSNLFVPPNKITEYYAQHKNEFSSKEEVKLRMIMIPGQGNSGNSAAQKAMVEEIRAKIITGADFDRMAQMYSEDATRDLGGDWGWIDRKTLSEPLSNAAFGLKPGEFSSIVETDFGFHVIKRTQ